LIEAPDFVEPARARGIRTYASVPCSFLTPLIDYVIGDPGLRHVSAANEGDAVALAAGIALAGGRAAAMMQNSGLGNAVSPLTSLTWTFRLPVLVICTHRGAPGITDEPQHQLMGGITRELLDLMRLPVRDFPERVESVEPVLDEAFAHMDRERRPFALLVPKGALAPRPGPALPASAASTRVRREEHGFARMPGERVGRRDALERIAAVTGESVVIATTGYTGRELYAIEDRANQLYMVGSMGCASSLGLGLAMEVPETEVVVIDGDGAALMRMGNFATVGGYGGSNFTHVVLDNEVHDSTGGQPTVSSGVRFTEVAAACGYRSVFSGDDPALIDRVVGNPNVFGPRLLHLKIRPGTSERLPRPALPPDEVGARLTRHLAERFAAPATARSR
jgi:phosphonopyruvate decarboxylase